MHFLLLQTTPRPAASPISCMLAASGPYNLSNLLPIPITQTLQTRLSARPPARFMPTHLRDPGIIPRPPNPIPGVRDVCKFSDHTATDGNHRVRAGSLQFLTKGQGTVHGRLRSQEQWHFCPRPHRPPLRERLSALFLHHDTRRKRLGTAG